MRRITLPAAAVVVLLGVAGCGGGEEPAAVEETAPAVEVPDYEVVRDEGRMTELLSEGVDAAGAEAIIRAWVDEHQDGWEAAHTVQVIDDPDAGMVVCRARWIEDEEASQIQTGGSVTPEDGEWPAVELNCPQG